MTDNNQAVVFNEQVALAIRGIVKDELKSVLELVQALSKKLIVPHTENIEPASTPELESSQETLPPIDPTASEGVHSCSFNGLLKLPRDITKPLGDPRNNVLFLSKITGLGFNGNFSITFAEDLEPFVEYAVENYVIRGFMGHMEISMDDLIKEFPLYQNNFDPSEFTAKFEYDFSVIYNEQYGPSLNNVKHSRIGLYKNGVYVSYFPVIELGFVIKPEKMVELVVAADYAAPAVVDDLEQPVVTADESPLVDTNDYSTISDIKKFDNTKPFHLVGFISPTIDGQHVQFKFDKPRSFTQLPVSNEYTTSFLVEDIFHIDVNENDARNLSFPGGPEVESIVLHLKAIVERDDADTVHLKEHFYGTYLEVKYKGGQLQSSLPVRKLLIENVPKKAELTFVDKEDLSVFSALRNSVPEPVFFGEWLDLLSGQTFNKLTLTKVRLGFTEKHNLLDISVPLNIVPYTTTSCGFDFLDLQQTESCVLNAEQRQKLALCLGSSLTVRKAEMFIKLRLRLHNGVLQLNSNTSTITATFSRSGEEWKDASWEETLSIAEVHFLAE